MSSQLLELQELLKYKFKDERLLEVALTHPSFGRFGHGEVENYQRLEFLGDSVLSLALSETLYKLFPLEREGVLAKYRAGLVRGRCLTALAKKLQLQFFIRSNPSEFPNIESYTDSILEDCLEALFGAIFLDCGFEKTQNLILDLYGDIKGRLLEVLSNDNPKGQLQEMIQQSMPDGLIEYELENQAGPPHRSVFTMSLTINGVKIATGSGLSKKMAEEEAAMKGLKEMMKFSGLEG